MARAPARRARRPGGFEGGQQGRRRRDPPARLRAGRSTSGAGLPLPSFLTIVALGDRLYVHGDADLRGARADADRQEEQNVVTFKQVIQENRSLARLLADAVEDAAEPRAGAADDRRREAVEPSRSSTHKPTASSGSARRFVARPSVACVTARSRQPRPRRSNETRRSQPRSTASSATSRCRRSATAASSTSSSSRPIPRLPPPRQRLAKATSSRTWSTNSSRRRTPPTGSASARRTAQAGRGERAGAAALPGADDAVSLEDKQNIVVQKLADLNGAVTASQDRADQKEALTTRCKHCQNDPRRARHLPGDSLEHLHPAAEGELAELQRQQAQLGEKLGPEHPEMVKLASAIQSTQTRLAAEIAKVVQSVKNDYMSALAQEHSLIAALNAEAGRAGAEPQGHRLRRPAARRGEQPADLRRADAADEGDRHFRRAKDEQHADRRCGRSSPRAGSSSEGSTLLMALLGGGALAIGCAFFLEYLDNRIKIPRRDRESSGAPVPRSGARRGQKALAEPTRR